VAWAPDPDPRQTTGMGTRAMVPVLDIDCGRC